MDRAELVTSLTAGILEQRVPGHPFKVAIDGRCGSGKSTLAEELAAKLGGLGLEVLRVSVDGFHHPRVHRYRQGEDSARGYYEDAFDYGAVVENLLRPLSGEAFPAKCWVASLDLDTDRGTDAPPVSVNADVVLMFEGVFALRKELNSYWDLRVLLNVDAETAIARAALRDAGAAEAENIRRKYRVRYEPAWLLYLQYENPGGRADLVIEL